MVKHTKIGSKGEEIAAGFLVNKGYKILHRNWRSGKKELDIIATNGDLLVIAEIKTRSNFDFGFPEEAVNKKKQKFIKSAAEAFIEANRQYMNIRFDIISILMDGEHVKEIMHFEEAFY
jgi:putative endonuclease